MLGLHRSIIQQWQMSPCIIHERRSMPGSRRSQRASQRRSRRGVLAYRWRLPVDPPLHLPGDSSLLLHLSRTSCSHVRRLVALAGDDGDTVLALRRAVPSLPFAVVTEEIFSLKVHSINFACELVCQRGDLSTSCLMLPVAHCFLEFKV